VTGGPVSLGERHRGGKKEKSNGRGIPHLLEKDYKNDRKGLAAIYLLSRVKAFRKVISLKRREDYLSLRGFVRKNGGH